jgi:LysM repeat protein
MEKETALQKIAGYLVLLLVAALLLIGLQMGVDAEEASQTDTDGAIPLPNSTVLAFHERTEDKNQASSSAGEPLPIISDNFLAPAPVPRTYEGKKPHHEFETYTVERGDTPSEIAYQFGIKTETLLGGNPMLSQESIILRIRRYFARRKWYRAGDCWHGNLRLSSRLQKLYAEVLVWPSRGRYRACRGIRCVRCRYRNCDLCRLEYLWLR